MTKLYTPHLTYKEITCHCGVCGLNFLNPYIAAVFERIRKDAGDNSLIVTSAIRCIYWNIKVGGHRYSVHIYGLALDIAKPKWMALEEFYKICCEEVEDGGCGIYRKKGFVHCDCGHLIGLKKKRRWEE